MCLLSVFSAQFTQYIKTMNNTCMGARMGGGASVGRCPPLENQKKKKVEKNVEKILTCKRPPSYVMQGSFTTKGSYVMR